MIQGYSILYLKIKWFLDIKYQIKHYILKFFNVIQLILSIKETGLVKLYWHNETHLVLCFIRSLEKWYILQYSSFELYHWEKLLILC